MSLPPPPLRLSLALRAWPLALLILVGCEDAAPPPAPEIRPVRVIAAERSAGGDVVSLTGTVQAETQVNLAFRIDGRMVERLVNVGDQVRPGQVVARLNRDNEENGLRAARAQVTAAAREDAFPVHSVIYRTCQLPPQPFLLCCTFRGTSMR
jgi:multidrug efflux pump subunit AcrA (membrane-fusion protein)